MKYSIFSYKLFFILLLVFGFAKAQFITVDNSTYSDYQLVADKFIGTQNLSCVSISNVKVSGGNIGGSNSSYGFFTKGTSSFPMNEGIILSTGSVLAAPGPKGAIQDVSASGWIGDPDLADALRLPVSDLTNATVLEFDFSSTLSDKVSFRYMFLSEEYYTGNYSYSDAFAFLIKEAGSTDPYTNIALVPGTNDPVSVTTINDITNDKYFGGFIGIDNPSASATNFNGQTKILTAVADIKPGTNYHIKLVIADEKNYRYDSAVFLEAGSFTGNIDLLPAIETDDSAIICDSTLGIELKPKNLISDLGATYKWTEDSNPGVVLSSNPTYPTNAPGNYRLEVKLSSGCTLAGNIRVENAPVAIIDNSPIMICDDDFDGKYIEKLSKFTNQIVTNFNRDFKVEYYTQAGTQINPDNNFEFTQNPQDITVKVGAFSCAPDSYQISFYHGQPLSMNYPQNVTPTFDICDDELDGFKDVNLEAIVDSEMTNVIGATKMFYKTEAEAKKGDPSTVANINPKLTPTNSDVTYYVRIENSAVGSCPNYGSFRLLFKQPKKSTVLKDTLICPRTTVDLDAGTGIDSSSLAGFTSYKWYKESEPLIILSNNQTAEKISVGNYIVELGFNNCVYKQSVKVSEPADLVIDNILIEGNNATVLVSNGLPPYQYSLDGQSYQPGNVFENIPKGDHTIEVMDACGSIARDFSVINVKNIITPNGDGKNDTIDYSDLMTKSEPRLEIYDRNGILVFKGNPENQYIWNGKLNGKPLPTTSYWYILEWNEAGNPKRAQHTGWILLKNRN
ncbi:T9SS C-terminal target domain-containing protein [Epilithonimonas caeni]|uniref:T9SS C-terminal target domain-containing protein n=1 Tax=Epilithonimonas caeni TaxID=365343 RepID=UPI000402086A|nr:T9SS C-terminal target domain-containing protein [Epilithonimonas caeni]